ncbi:MAG: hypothetical protein H7267_03275 [Sandarakinorhabdus sp.]|nr:hypothetical protein [Sandarakinorhabdus sp.]
MKFAEGSPLSDAELAALSKTMVDTHGEAARDVVNRLIDEQMLPAILSSMRHG